MTRVPRIRPRRWTSRTSGPGRAEPSRRWWLPLSLVFRRQRDPAGTKEITVRVAQPAVPPAIENLSRHIHYHLHEGQRIFTRQGGRREIAAAPAGRAETPTASAGSRAAAPAGELARTRRQFEERVVSREHFRDQRHVHVEREMVNLRHVLRSRTSDRSFLRITEGLEASGRSRAVELPTVPALQILRPGRPGAPSPRNLGGREVFRRLTDAPMRRASAVAAAESRGVGVVLQRVRIGPAEAADPAAAVARPRPATIAWRQAQPKTEPAEAPALRATAPVAATGSNPAAAQAAAPAVRASVEEPGPAVWKFEGPAMDRLAEDVMQRIDRRIRIERERRGM